ncbi:hypothetical protein C8R48DRAFT_774858 [Suillus tomentosus]|nr:hypothetical protein C8R48DRAFT_774858 [Suillus tomentosus]
MSFRAKHPRWLPALLRGPLRRAVYSGALPNPGDTSLVFLLRSDLQQHGLELLRQCHRFFRPSLKFLHNATHDLAMLTQPNTLPHRLDLKANAVCTIQRNMSIETGLSSVFKLDRESQTVSPASAYATAFNGSAGLTLENASLDLRTDSFAHGQLYTALSTKTSQGERTEALYDISNTKTQIYKNI